MAKQPTFPTPPPSLKNWTQKDRKLNDFAIRSFRHVADADYIAARLAYRAQLPVQFLWACQQTLEKYLKFVLFLERVKAPKIGHHLAPALEAIEASGLKLELTQGTKKFIEKIDQVGRHRYMEVSIFVEWPRIIALDRAVWELRRFCTSEPYPRTLKLTDGQRAPSYSINQGSLEEILRDKNSPARRGLIWHNAFVGRKRKSVTIYGSFVAKNSPLFNYPELLDTLVQYVHIPKDVAQGYRELAKERAADRAKAKKQS
jgi:hypothetical protein